MKLSGRVVAAALASGEEDGARRPEGSVVRVRLKVSGVGISGPAHARVHASEECEGVDRGIGVVYYGGAPHVRERVMGMGNALAGILVGIAGSGWPAITPDGLTFFIFIPLIGRMSVAQVCSAAESGGSCDWLMRELGESQRFVAGQRFFVMVLMVGSAAVLALEH